MVLVKNADSQAYPRPAASLDVGPRGSPGPSLARVAFTASFLREPTSRSTRPLRLAHFVLSWPALTSQGLQK